MAAELRLTCELLYYEATEIDRQNTVTEHRHPFWQVEIGTAGSFRSRVDSVPRAVEVGDILMIPPGVAHSFRHAPGDAWISCKARLTGLSVSAASGMLVSSAAACGLRDTLVAVLSPERTLTAADRVAVEHALAGLIAIHATPVQPALPLHRDSLVSRVMAHVDQRSERRLTVTELAKHFDFSASHLSARFRRATGQSLKSYIDQQRAMAAARLLMYSDLTITQIAQTMAFSDVFAFSKFFKTRKGLSPRQFRQDALGHAAESYNLERRS